MVGGTLGASRICRLPTFERLYRVSHGIATCRSGKHTVHVRLDAIVGMSAPVWQLTSRTCSEQQVSLYRGVLDHCCATLSSMRPPIPQYDSIEVPRRYTLPSLTRQSHSSSRFLPFQLSRFPVCDGNLKAQHVFFCRPNTLLVRQVSHAYCCQPPYAEGLLVQARGAVATIMRSSRNNQAPSPVTSIADNHARILM